MDQQETQTETQTAAPDFTAEWRQIREDLESEAAGALRIGQNLIKIRDALKPLGLWLAALREHRMSQEQAWRYTTFAEMPEAEREPYMRLEGPFSLTKAIEGRSNKRSKKPAGPAPDYSSTNTPEIPDDERADWLAEIDQRVKLAVKMVSRGEEVLMGDPQPEYAADDARWTQKVSDVAEAVLTVIEAHEAQQLRKELERQFPCR
jgi:hypothetical protein